MIFSAEISDNNAAANDSKDKKHPRASRTTVRAGAYHLKDYVSTAIVGVRNPNEAAINCAAMAWSLSDEEMKKLRSREDPAFPYLFAIVGDISVKSEYCRNVLLVSEKKIDTYEIDTDHFGRSVALDEVESAQNKRMYGNALLRLKLKSGDGEHLPLHIQRQRPQ